MTDDSQTTDPDYLVVLVQCTKDKRDGSHPARDLYDPSDYFRKQRTYATQRADRWFVQSAKHGLVAPDQVIEDYDVRASDLADPDGWADQIATDLADQIPASATVSILGGRDYADPLTPCLETRGFEVHEPLRGMKFGVRKSKLAEWNRVHQARQDHADVTSFGEP